MFTNEINNYSLLIEALDRISKSELENQKNADSVSVEKNDLHSDTKRTKEPI